MPATAGSAQTSSMKIKGSLDTTDLDTGFGRVQKHFESVKGSAKGFTSDLYRMAQVAGGLAKTMIKLGLVGATAMVGIASKAPAVAPALAKMGVAFDKLTRHLGEALAPAFEKVAGWLDKLAVWVGNNKEQIGEVAMKFVEWGEAIGKTVWPWLEKVGQWAMDHPGLFAGIVAGLALAPAVISGIAAISGLVTTMTTAAIAPGVLTALGYIAAIAGAAYVGEKALRGVSESIRGAMYEEAEQIPGTLPALRSVDRGASDIAREGFQPTPDGLWSASDTTRRHWFLKLWDGVWG